MTDYEITRRGVKVNVPPAVEYHNGERRKAKVKVGGMMVLNIPLTAENMDQLRGADRDGVATSAVVWDVLTDALRRYTTGADRILPDEA